MTISTQASSVTLAGNGATTAFNFSFVGAAAADIGVMFTSATGVQTVLAPSQYTLVLNPPAVGQIWGVGGTVTYPISGTPIAAGTLLTITRTLPLTQVISISNQGDFYPQSVEQALDTLCMELQQVSGSAGRAITINPADLVAANPLPIAAERAGQVMGFDSTGQPIVAQPSSALVSAAMQPVVSAATIAAAETLLGISPAMQPVVAAATIAAAAAALGVNPISGVPNIPITPFAQGGLTINVLSSINATAASTTLGEFSFSALMNNAVGGGGSVGASQNKVAIYGATETKPGGGNGWAFNGLLLIDSGAAAIGGQQICEWDLANNSGTNFGDAAGFDGVEQPSVLGVQITGISTNRVTAALAIFGNLPGNAPMWNRGIVAGPFTIRQSFLEDYSNSQQSYLVQGSHTYGIDFQGQVGTPAVFSQAPIRFGAQHKMMWRNQANTADLNMIQGSGTDQLVIGTDATGVVLESPSVAHTGTSLGFYNAAPTTKPTVSGSKGGNAALSSLINALVTLGLLTDATS